MLHLQTHLHGKELLTISKKNKDLKAFTAPMVGFEKGFVRATKARIFNYKHLLCSERIHSFVP